MVAKRWEGQPCSPSHHHHHHHPFHHHHPHAHDSDHHYLVKGRKRGADGRFYCSAPPTKSSHSATIGDGDDDNDAENLTII